MIRAGHPIDPSTRRARLRPRPAQRRAGGEDRIAAARALPAHDRRGHSPAGPRPPARRRSALPGGRGGPRLRARRRHHQRLEAARLPLRGTGLAAVPSSMTASGAVLDLSLPQLGLALLLVGVIIAISIYQRLGIAGDVVVGTLRAMVQLYLVGLILAVVFRAARWYWVLLILVVMTAVAAQAATGRLGKPLPGGGVTAAFALTVSTAVTLFVRLAVARYLPPAHQFPRSRL